MTLAFSANDPGLIPDMYSVLIRGFALTPGACEVYGATDENGALVAYEIFSLPGKLAFDTWVIPHLLYSESGSLTRATKQ